jgi:hypothetical protein
MSPNSSHVDRIQGGHGACTECDCKQFTWVKFCNVNGEEYSDRELKIELNEIKKSRELAINLLNNKLKQGEEKLR